MPWDPSRYLAYGAERLRPALDLLARVPLEAPGRVADLGCGTGTSTRLLKARWPEARVVGVDASPEMLAAARAASEDVSWEQADLRAWRSGAPLDLIFSNAALHWLDDHESLLASLLGQLSPGGCLAVQMPRNQDRPSHQTVFEVIGRNPAWARRLAPLVRPAPVAPLEAYLAWLGPGAAHLDLWETDYLHRLAGPDPVLDWIRGSFLTPLLDGLDAPERGPFLEACRTALRAAYPADPSGWTPFRFRRLFLVVRL